MFPFKVNNRITNCKEFTGKLPIEIYASVQRKPNRAHFRIFGKKRFVRRFELFIQQWII